MVAKNKGDLRQGAADTYFQNTQGLITADSDRDQHYDEIDSAGNLLEPTLQTFTGEIDFTGGVTKNGLEIDQSDNITNNSTVPGVSVSDALEDLQKLSFLVTTMDTIPVSDDPDATSFFTGFALSGSSAGFTLNPTDGSIQNTSGRDIARMSGTISYQPVKMAGGTNILYMWSERSSDGIVWVEESGSLRSLDITTDGELFKTSVSVPSDWLSGEHFRFSFYEEGTGDINFESPSTTVNGNLVVGASAAWQLKED